MCEILGRDQIDKDNQRYFDLIRIGRGNEYVGAAYVAWWYRRNLVILDNIIRLTDSPNDRILVVYGVGHAKLLNQFATESGFYDVESPLKYLKGKIDRTKRRQVGALQRPKQMGLRGG